VTRRDVACTDVVERWIDMAAHGYAQPAPGVKATAAGRVDRARHVALEDNSLPLGLGIRNGDRAEQSLRIWVERGTVDLVSGADFNDLSEVHNGHSVGNVLYDRQIMRNEQVGQSVFFLELL